MKVKIKYYYTMDYGTWYCPKCSRLNTMTVFNLDNANICADCGFKIEGLVNRLPETGELIEEEYEIKGNKLRKINQ